MRTNRAALRVPEHRNGLRQGQDGRCEDDRHNAGRIDLDRQVGGLTAVHLAANYALCVLNRDAALCIRHINDEYNDRKTDDNHCNAGNDAARAGLEQVNQRTHERRTAGNDTCEQDDRNAVADTLLGDMLAHPHNQRGACGESYDNGYGCKRAGVGQHSLAAKTVAEQCVVGQALEQTEQNAEVTGPACNLLTAFLAAVLYHALKSGDGNGQQLKDDGCVDIRGDGHCEDGRTRQTTAGEHIQITKHRTVYRCLLKVLRQERGINKRNRNARTKAEDQDDEQSVQHLLAQFGHRPGVFKGLKHLKPPRPFRLRLRSSPLRKPRKQLP